MNLIDIFRSRKKSSAAIAKERLQIIVSHERVNRNGPEYLPMLQKELLQVISKYVKVDTNKVNVSLQNSGDYSILELNVTLQDED